MSGGSKDDRPPLAAAMQWVHQITSIALEMALPAFLGHWLDQRWRTEPWLVSVGAGLGFAAAMVHLLALAKKGNRRPAGRRQQGGDVGPRGTSDRGGD